MMGFRVGCFLLTIILFASGAGWLAAIPAVGAIVIPYIAVVFANGGREPTSTRGFRAYEPKLPERYSGPGQGAPGSRVTAGWPAPANNETLKRARPTSYSVHSSDVPVTFCNNAGQAQMNPEC